MKRIASFLVMFSMLLGMLAHANAAVASPGHSAGRALSYGLTCGPRKSVWHTSSFGNKELYFDDTACIRLVELPNGMRIVYGSAKMDARGTGGVLAYRETVVLRDITAGTSAQVMVTAKPWNENDLISISWEIGRAHV